MKYMRLSLLSMLCGVLSLSACLVTVVNDSSNAILVVNHNERDNEQKLKTIIFIPKNSSRRIGRSDELAHFTIYTKPPKNGHFYMAHTVQQKHCGPNGNPILKLSEIRKNSGPNVSLFTITHNENGNSSMVRQLPSMQKPDIFKQNSSTECSACKHHGM
jgi:hypothetical protein